jgi:GNAT superfamily N-acetyltransferase
VPQVISELVEIRRLAETHVAEAVPLAAEAGWNQTAADWRLMLNLGEGFGLWEPGGRLVATTIVLPFGGRFAWIGMVLVTNDFQRRGLATRLLHHAVAVLVERGLTSMLDATPAGARIYEPLGFVGLYRLQRLQAPEKSQSASVSAVPPLGLSVRPATPADLGAIAAFDAPAFGADRAPILAHLLGRQPARAFVAERSGRLAGYALARDGRAAHHSGPLVADDQATAIALADRALAGIDRPVYMDVLDRHETLRAWLAGRGFVPQRPFTRMAYRRSAPFDDTDRVMAIAGPELG